MRFRRHMWWASIFVLIPVVALVVVGILVLVFQRETVDITFGVLILTFCVTLLVGAIVLVVSLKRATDLSQLQLDFLSKVSHEFRTPLTSIRLFTETLMGARALTDDQRQQCLNMLDHETERLSTMIGRLLDFGRMEAGAATVRFEPTDLGSVVAAVVQEFRADPAAGRHPVDLENGGSVPVVRLDRESFGRALWNLLDNAAKYSPADAPIEVQTTAVGPRAVVRVRDQGIGVPAAERQSIFRKFVRGADQRSSGIRGTGVGLAMVDQIVRAHGGEIRLDSEVGVGSEFTIVLPAITEPPRAPLSGAIG